jgi:hypothetical protein
VIFLINRIEGALFLMKSSIFSFFKADTKSVPLFFKERLVFFKLVVKLLIIEKY